MQLDEIKDSGILELYVLGDLSPVENEKIEQAIADFPELKKEVLEIEKAFENYALANSMDVPATVKPLLITTVNYTERILNGETPSSPPALTKDSKIVDYKTWLDRTDLQEPDKYESMYGHIIGATEERTTLIIWLKEGAPPEIHTKEYEKFLIVEGTCDITIGEETHSLKAGDFLEIPLFVSHHVQVTSSIRCQIILERAAA